MRIKRVLGIFVAAVIVVYAVDFLSARFGFPDHREIYGSVVVKRTYAVLQKSKKEEYYFLPPETQTCVNALFPHFGAPPCWYLRRHQTQQVQM
jgi:hypothetical protein